MIAWAWLVMWTGFFMYALFWTQSPHLAFICGFFGIVPVGLYCWGFAAWRYPTRPISYRLKDNE